MPYYTSGRTSPGPRVPSICPYAKVSAPTDSSRSIISLHVSTIYRYLINPSTTRTTWYFTSMLLSSKSTTLGGHEWRLVQDHSNIARAQHNNHTTTLQVCLDVPIEYRRHRAVQYKRWRFFSRLSLLLDGTCRSIVSVRYTYFSILHPSTTHHTNIIWSFIDCVFKYRF